MRKRVFDTAERSAAADTQAKFVYSENVPSYAIVTHWAAEFWRGRRSLQDKPWWGRPCEAVCEENCRAIKNTVLQNC